MRLRTPARSVGLVVAASAGYELLLGGSTPPVGIVVQAGFIGLSYSMLAIGLMLIYRATRVLNLAQGELGAAPAIAGILLIKLEHWPYVAAVGVTVLSAALLGAFCELAFIRRFAKAPRLVVMIATIGLSLLLALLEILIPTWFGVSLNGRGGRILSSEPPHTPFTDFHFLIGGVRFDGNLLAIAVVAGAAVLALALFFKRSNVGLAVRASAENADRARLMGIRVHRLSTVVWVLAAILSALAVFLQTAVTGVNVGSDIGPTALIYGLSAAIFARMESFPLALVGGIGMGILTQSIFYVYNDPYLPGAVAVPVLVILLLLQSGKLSRGQDSGVSSFRQAAEFRPVPPELRRLPEVVLGKLGLTGLLLVVAILAPLGLDVGKQELAAIVLIYAIVCVSLVVLTGWAGQISLGQWGFAGVGAFTAGALGAHAHADFTVCLLAAGAAGAVVAVGIGLPALRIQGPFLAATTLAFSIAVSVFLLNPTYFGSYLPDTVHTLDRPLLYGRVDISSPVAYYYLVLGFLLAALASCAMLRRSRAGRAIIALRDNTRGAQSFGISRAGATLAAFAISGFWSALAGALFVFAERALDSSAFDPNVSVLLIITVVIGGVTSLSGSLLAAVYLGVLQYGGFGQQVQLFATGVGVLLLLMLSPGGLAQQLFNIRDAVLRRVAARRGLEVPSLIADRRPETTLHEARQAALVAAHREAVGASA